MDTITYCPTCGTHHNRTVEFKKLVALQPGDVIAMMGGSPDRTVVSNDIDPQGRSRVEWTDGEVYASEIPSPMSQQSLTEIVLKCHWRVDNRR